MTHYDRHNCIQITKHTSLADIFSPSLKESRLLYNFWFLAIIAERNEAEDRFITMTLTQNFLGHIWIESMATTCYLNTNFMRLKSGLSPILDVFTISSA